MNKERLEGIKRDLEEGLYDISLDFVSDYSIEDDHYISDLFSEYADSVVSVYSYDQHNYFLDHSSDCEDALLELYDGDSLANMIKDKGLYELCCLAGVCGEYRQNYNMLSEDEENIKKLLIIRYLLKNDIFTLSTQQLSDLLDDAADCDNDKTSDLLELVNQYLAEAEDEK